MPPVQFAVNSYQARALPLSAQRTVNYFAEAAPKDAKSQVVVLNAPGTKNFTTGLVGGSRGTKVMGGVLYVVAGCGGELVCNDDIGGGLTTSAVTVECAFAVGPYSSEEHKRTAPCAPTPGAG